VDIEEWYRKKKEPGQTPAQSDFQTRLEKRAEDKRAAARLKAEQDFIARNPAQIVDDNGEQVIKIRLSPSPVGPKLQARREQLWGPGAAVAHGLTLGLGGPTLMAGAGTTGRFLDDLIAGNPNAVSNIPENFGTIFGEVRDAKQAYQDENPVQNFIAETAGSILPVGKAIQLAERVGDAAIRTVAPQVGQTISRFMGGQAGRTVVPVAGQSRYIPTANSLLPPLSRAAQFGQQGAVGALATSNMYDVPVEEQLAYGAGLGALMGASPLGRAMQEISDRAMPAIVPSVARSADVAERIGVPISAMQLPPGETWGAINETAGSLGNQQLNAVNRYAFRSIGLPDVNDVSPQEFARQRTNLSQNLDNIVSQVDVPVTPALIGDLQSIAGNLSNDPIAMQGAGNVYGLINDLVDTFNQYGGNIPGAEFRKLTGTNSTLDKLLSSENGYVRSYAARVKDSLYNAFENSSQLGTGQSAAPLMQEFRDTRNQLNNWYTISQSGAYNPTAGKIDPRQLAEYITPENYFQRNGALNDVSQIRNFLPNMNDSGGAVYAHPGINRLMNYAGSGGMLGGGGALGYSLGTGNVVGPLGIAASGLAAMTGVSHLASSPSFRNAMLNRTLGGNRPVSTRGNALLEGGNLTRKALPSMVATRNPWYSVFQQEQQEQ
jgi:hypothetical protein